MDPRPFGLWHALPASLREVLPNVTWDRQRLHGLALPVVEIAVDELGWQLELPWWRDGDRTFAVSPRAVRDDPARFARHWRRTLGADLAYPIHLLERDGGRRIILDGVHRLLKAVVLEHPTIAAHVLDVEQLGACLVGAGMDAAIAR